MSSIVETMPSMIYTNTRRSKYEEAIRQNYDGNVGREGKMNMSMFQAEKIFVASSQSS